MTVAPQHPLEHAYVGADPMEMVATRLGPMQRTVDPRTGYKEHRFVGQQSFVKQMTIPGRRVVSFSRPYETLANYNRSNERMREVANV